ncbi:MAG: permease, partial [Spirochaetales bacterium]|nr:permease [Spirochaetales bacterium]
EEVLLLFTQMSPYLLLGVSVAGLLSVFVKRDLVARHVGGHNAGSVIKASLLGVPLPLCSCGVIPTASYLKKYGASKPAVMSFLISTPQTGVDSIAATWGMLGPLFALFKAVTALFTGIFGGLVSFLFDKDGSSEETQVGPEREEETLSLKSRLSRFADFAYKESIDDIAVNFLVGLVLAALISLLIPDNFFEGTLFGSGFLSMLLMVIIGIPMYVCSTSSIPIAVSLILKGFSPGAAYVFLVAGPATNAATLAILAKVLGRKQTLAYLGTIIAGSLIFGALMNRITIMTGWEFTGSLMHYHEAPGLGDYFFSGLFFLLLAASFYRRFTSKKSCSSEGCSCHGEEHEAG